MEAGLGSAAGIGVAGAFQLGDAVGDQREIGRPGAVGREQRVRAAERDVVVSKIPQLRPAYRAQPLVPDARRASGHITDEAAAVASPAGDEEAVGAQGGEGLADGDGRDAEGLGQVALARQLLPLDEQAQPMPSDSRRITASARLPTSSGA